MSTTINVFISVSTSGGVYCIRDIKLSHIVWAVIIDINYDMRQPTTIVTIYRLHDFGETETERKSKQIDL